MKAVQQFHRRFPPAWQPCQLANQKVLVVGLGTFGGGEGVTRFLLSQGAKVTVTDLRAESQFGELPDSLRAGGARLVLGEHRRQDLEWADWVVASPAVPLNSEFLQAVARTNKPLETEISLLCRLLPCRWLGITGTNGKSTTAMLAARAIGSSRRVFLGGNLGGSLLGEISEIRPDDAVVLELSSFQLEHLGAMSISPPVALVTNVTVDHLDRHGTRANYVAAKAAILQSAELAVLCADDRETERMGSEFPGQVIWFGTRTESGRKGCFWDGSVLFAEGSQPAQRASIESFPLLGAHNKSNLAGAIGAAVFGFGATFDRAVRAALTTQPIYGRMNDLGMVDGVRFVDDCVATSPVPVAAALTSLDGVIHLIAGGYDKGLDTLEMRRAILDRGAVVHLYGASASQLAEELTADLEQWVRQQGQSARKPTARWQVHADLASAFRSAAEAAKPGETVLLSPGFASYDQFRNFRERGELFRRLVAALSAP